LVFPSYEISDDSYYLFTCGELKVREREFVEKHQLERLLNAKTIDKFIKVLQETYYGRYLSDIEENENFNSILISELTNIANFLKERLKPEHQIAGKLLTLEEDLHNIKLIAKSKILGRDLKELFIPISYPYNQLKEAVARDNYENIDPQTTQILQYAIDLTDEEKDYKIVELKLESFYLERLFDKITSIKSRMLGDLIRHIIDIFNIENICRYKYSESKFAFDFFVYKNGFLEAEFLKQFEKKSIDDFVKSMKETMYAKLVEKGVHLLFTDNAFSSFEISRDLFYVYFFDSIKYSISNLEKIIEFFYRKKIELKSLNVIFMGILYNIDKDKIRSRIAILNENKDRGNW